MMSFTLGNETVSVFALLFIAWDIIDNQKSLMP